MDSVLTQDYRNIEVLISDNASSDGTAGYCTALADSEPRVRCFRHERNVGADANFAFVARQSRGQFVMWLADDDTLLPGALRAAINCLTEHPDVVLVAGRSLITHPTGSVVSGEPITLTSNSSAERIRSYYGAVIYNSIFYGMWRGTSLDAVLPMPNVLGGDWILISRAAWLGKVVTLPAPFSIRAGWPAERSMRTLPLQLGLPDWHGRIPYAVIAWNAATSAFSLARKDGCSVRFSAALATRCGGTVVRRFSAVRSPRALAVLALRLLPSSTDRAVRRQIHRWRSRQPHPRHGGSS